MDNLACYSVFSKHEEIILFVCSGSFGSWYFIMQQPKTRHETCAQKVQLSNLGLKQLGHG